MRNQGESVAVTLGTARPADPVNVGIDGVRHIVVDDMRDAFHIQATCGDIGRNHDLIVAALETTERRLALTLSTIAVQARHPVTKASDLLRQARGTMLGAGEHKYRLRFSPLEESDQERGFQMVINRENGMGNGVSRTAQSDGDTTRVSKSLARQFFDFRWKGRGEQEGLAVSRKVSEYSR